MELSRKNTGQFFRDTADVITYGRTDAGNLVALNIMLDDEILPDAFRHRSIGSMVLMATLGFADKADGMCARYAEKLGIEITKEDREKDPIEDKKFNKAVMESLAMREYSEGNTFYASMLAANLFVTNIRDEKMDNSRADAVDGADTSAIRMNKYKTGAQNLAHTLAVSPITRSIFGRLLVGSIYCASTGMGLIGYQKAHKNHRGGS
jgi:hypothetical protein